MNQIRLFFVYVFAWGRAMGMAWIVYDVFKKDMDTPTGLLLGLLFFFLLWFGPLLIGFITGYGDRPDDKIPPIVWFPFEDPLK